MCNVQNITYQVFFFFFYPYFFLFNTFHLHAFRILNSTLILFMLLLLLLLLFCCWPWCKIIMKLFFISLWRKDAKQICFKNVLKSSALYCYSVPIIWFCTNKNLFCLASFCNYIKSKIRIIWHFVLFLHVFPML